jgi:glyoxalase family protein
MGLRLVKKTVNQDSPTVYHLFFADEDGDPGADLTFFEYPGTPVGRPGAGMVHRIVWRVAAAAALDFWEGRLGAHGIDVRREGRSLHFSDPEGLDHELFVADVPDAPLAADHPEVPKELALQGFHAVRAYAAAPDTSTRLLEALEFEPTDEGWEARGEERGGLYIFDPPPAEKGLQGAGSVHHVAWSSSIEEHMAWRDKAIAAGAHPTAEIDRFYFKSIYFREPSGGALRDRHARTGLHRRRAARAPRREALAAARLRAPARPGRAEPAPGRQSARAARLRSNRARVCV